jgi:hypothetical protein
VLRQIPLLQAQMPPLLDKLNAFLSPRLQELGIDVRLDWPASSCSRNRWHQRRRNLEFRAGVRPVGGTAVLAGWPPWFVPVVLFYLLLDWHRHLARAGPCRAAGPAVNTMASRGRQPAGTVPARPIAGDAGAGGLLFGCAGSRFDSALPVGVITGLLVFIPYLGFGLGLVLAILAAVLQFDGAIGLLWVALIYGVGQVLESFILTPKLVGERIGLHRWW